MLDIPNIVSDERELQVQNEALRQELYEAHSARKQAEIRLKELEDRLSLALKSALVGTWSWGVQENKIIWDDYIGSLFGRSREELPVTYEEFLELLDPRDRLRVHAQVMKSVENNEEYDTDYRVLWPDASTRILAARGRVFRDTQGRPIKMTGVCWDITERKHTEQILQEKTHALEKSNQELQQFAYVTSHDLQEPLRMVTNYLELIERRYQAHLDESGKEFIAFASDGAKRMKGLIDDLLSYTRVETKGDEFASTPLQDVLTKTLKNLEIEIQEKNAKITFDKLPIVLGDELQLIQLFQNLIGNALKYCEKKTPQVHIGVQQKNDRWILSFQDNGIGIAPEFYDRVFAVFQRLHTRKDYPGTGIGLAICKKIVERHRGKIWVDSVPGQGSTFYFSIPVLKREKR